MFAYGGPQVEREESAHSLSSRGGSELGSRYAMESGIYMSSFAAAVFVSALVTAGVLLLTLLITLTVMLQSCQRKNNGAVERWRSPFGSGDSVDDYDYCKILGSHLELNGLNLDLLPAFCERVMVKYVKEGEYARELSITVNIVEDFLSSLRPSKDGLDVVLLDLDDFLPEDYNLLIPPRLGRQIIEEAKQVKSGVFQKFCMKIEADGWQLILFSRKSVTLQNATRSHLISAGFGGSSLLIMRSTGLKDEMEMKSDEYLSKRMRRVEDEGFRIMAVISSHIDALVGPYLGKRVFKIGNPVYYNTYTSIDIEKSS